MGIDVDTNGSITDVTFQEVWQRDVFLFDESSMAYEFVYIVSRKFSVDASEVTFLVPDTGEMFGLFTDDMPLSHILGNGMRVKMWIPDEQCEEEFE